MKKKIIALTLVLVLSMAMMVPVFAAAANPTSTNGCPGSSWVSMWQTPEGPYYEWINSKQHMEYYTMGYICQNCGETKVASILSTPKLHPSGSNPCYLCGRENSN